MASPAAMTFRSRFLVLLPMVLLSGCQGSPSVRLWPGARPLIGEGAAVSIQKGMMVIEQRTGRGYAHSAGKLGLQGSAVLRLRCRIIAEGRPALLVRLATFGKSLQEARPIRYPWPPLREGRETDIEVLLPAPLAPLRLVDKRVRLLALVVFGGLCGYSSIYVLSPMGLHHLDVSMPRILIHFYPAAVVLTGRLHALLLRDRFSPVAESDSR